jgi:hypothetical protein
MDEWKQQYNISKIRDDMAEEIKNELLKKFDTPHQKNIIKETINEVKRKHRLDDTKK